MNFSVKQQKLAVGAVLLLAASVAATAVVSANIPSEKLQDLEPEVEEQEKHLVFEDGETEIASFSASYLKGYDNRTGELPLKLVFTTAEGYKTESLKIRIRPEENPFGKVYLETPSGKPYPPIHFHESADSRASIIDIEDTGFQGRGTMTLNTFVDQHRTDDPDNVQVDLEAEVSKNGVIGKIYTVEGRIDIDPEKAGP